MYCMIVLGGGSEDLSRAVNDEAIVDCARYVLISPARNEGAFIEQTIKSVISQTIIPMRWVIVSDGSTDGTNDIVKRFASQYAWMEFVSLPERAGRNFEGKVGAFRIGYEKVRSLEYQFIGNLDADVSFEDPEYFNYLLQKFAEDPKLGVAGTPFREGTVQYDYRFSRKEHVSGACQLFRRECFESIGGYVPLKAGIDLAAVVSARMKGWRTETFTDKYCVHHRRMSSAKDGLIRATFRSGYYDYSLGVHPSWHFFHSVYQMRNKPYVLSGFLLMAGYLWAAVRRSPSFVSEEFAHFRRKEQVRWLKEFIEKILRLPGRSQD